MVSAISCIFDVVETMSDLHQGAVHLIAIPTALGNAVPAQMPQNEHVYHKLFGLCGNTMPMLQTVSMSASLGSVGI